MFVKDVWLVFSERYGQTTFGAGWAAQPVPHGGTRTQRELALRIGANQCVLAYIRVGFGTVQSSQITGIPPAPGGTNSRKPHATVRCEQRPPRGAGGSGGSESPSGL